MKKRILILGVDGLNSLSAAIKDLSESHDIKVVDAGSSLAEEVEDLNRSEYKITMNVMPYDPLILKEDKYKSSHPFGKFINDKRKKQP
tara:strand:+ start:59 stop:322 length:264 start_codon:yes stop_codon:yes gene_type:complete